LLLSHIRIGGRHIGMIVSNAAPLDRMAEIFKCSCEAFSTPDARIRAAR
jgi:hypothetical protein